MKTRIQNAKETLIKAGFCFIDHGAGQLQMIPRESQIAEAVLAKAAIPHHTSTLKRDHREHEVLVVEDPDTTV